jgi:hypothetical protein
MLIRRVGTGEWLAGRNGEPEANRKSQQRVSVTELVKEVDSKTNPPRADF